jgi:oligopeptide transport system substrate-binding protein
MNKDYLGWICKSRKKFEGIRYLFLKTLHVILVSIFFLMLIGCSSGFITPQTTVSASPSNIITPMSSTTPWPTITSVIAPPATLTPMVSPTIPPANLNALRLGMGLGTIMTIDPSQVEINNSENGLQIVEETTVGLTRLNETTSLVEPGMAKSWDVSADGLSYTFHLYDNVPWVKWDATSNQVLPVSDCDGYTRLVKAQDFQYGILRTISPSIHSKTAYLLTDIIMGASEYHQGTADADYVKVKAIDDWTLQIDFIIPGSYYATLIGLALAHAQPAWLIVGDDCTSGVGDRWTRIEFYESYGPYVLTEYEPSVHIALLKNPYWTGTEFISQPHIDTLRWDIFPPDNAIDEYSAEKVDVIEVPLDSISTIKTDPSLAKELIVEPSLCTYYFAFNAQAPVVNSPHLRRAMSMAVNREVLIRDVFDGLHMISAWFSAPGLSGAPTPYNSPNLGIKFNPVLAKKELDFYLHESGQKVDQLNITLTFNRGDIQRKAAEATQRMWKDILGLNVKLNEVDGKNYQELVNGPSSPQFWRNSYCYDYQDANNFLPEIFAVGGTSNPGYGGVNYFSPAFQDAIYKTQIHNDQATRLLNFSKAEEILNSDDAVVVPIFWYQQYELSKPYINRTVSQIGGVERFEKWSWK